MTDRLEIASRALPAIILATHDFPSDDATAVKWAFFYADALIAAHEATAKPAPPDDAPVVEWEVAVNPSGSGGHWAIAESFDAEGRSEVSAPMRRLKADADADLPAVRAAATAYSAAKGCRAVFVEEGCKDA